MSAYGLTDRERDVVQLILQGSSTQQIAEELVAKVFFARYEPRFRDNERRALKNKPLRRGPKSDLSAARMHQVWGMFLGRNHG